MTDKDKAQRSDETNKEASPKGKTKDNLVNYTKQLATLGALQNQVILNLQKEVENI